MCLFTRQFISKVLVFVRAQAVQKPDVDVVLCINVILYGLETAMALMS